MAKGAYRSGRGFDHDAHHRLGAIGEKKLEAVSALLPNVVSNRSALSTVFDGERPDGAGKEVEADLKDLEAALPEDSLLRDPAECDRYGTEPRILSYMRQLEGVRPQALAVLAPEDEAAARDAVTEARALGFTLTPGPRQIGLKVPSKIDIIDKASGELRLTAGTDWDAFTAAAASAGLAPMTACRHVWVSPVAAAESGVFGPIRRSKRFGHLWSVDIALPPVDVAVSEKCWIFPDSEGAAHAIRDIARQLAPLYAETFPALDGAILAAAKLGEKHRLLREKGAVGLRCLAHGIEPVRKAVLKAADAIARRTGGQPHWKKGLPHGGDLDTLIAAAGATRLVRPETDLLPVPDGALVTSCATSIRGDLSRRQVIVYIRDLARSVPEAQQVLGLPEDPDELASPPLAAVQNGQIHANG